MSEIRRQEESLWNECDAGELRQAVWRIKTQRRNESLARFGGVAVVLLLCAFAGTLIWKYTTDDKKADYGGVSCSQVKQDFAAYSAGELSPQLAKKIRSHLAKCGHCGKLVAGASPGEFVENQLANTPRRGGWATLGKAIRYE